MNDDAQAWNSTHPVGTRVIYTPKDGAPVATVTTSAARAHCGDTVVQVYGIVHPAWLSMVKPAEPPAAVFAAAGLRVRSTSVRELRTGWEVDLEPEEMVINLGQLHAQGFRGASISFEPARVYDSCVCEEEITLMWTRVVPGSAADGVSPRGSEG